MKESALVCYLLGDS